MNPADHAAVRELRDANKVADVALNPFKTARDLLGRGRITEFGGEGGEAFSIV